MICVYKYPKGNGRQMDETGFFSVMCSNKKRSHVLKLRHTKFCANTQKSCFTVRVTEHWNRLPRKAVGSLTNLIPFCDCMIGSVS